VRASFARRLSSATVMTFGVRAVRVMGRAWHGGMLPSKHHDWRVMLPGTHHILRPFPHPV